MKKGPSLKEEDYEHLDHLSVKSRLAKLFQKHANYYFQRESCILLFDSGELGNIYLYHKKGGRKTSKGGYKIKIGETIFSIKSEEEGVVVTNKHKNSPTFNEVLSEMEKSPAEYIPLESEATKEWLKKNDV